jgi:hypothetical protein
MKEREHAPQAATAERKGHTARKPMRRLEDQKETLKQDQKEADLEPENHSSFSTHKSAMNLVELDMPDRQ